jgi:hypothetical protein
MKTTRKHFSQEIYPDFVCKECAERAGGSSKRSRALCNMVATYHMGKCDICGQEKPLTQPRDFGYPNFNNLLNKGVKDALVN